MLKRILALFLGLAVLAERAARRCLPVRLLVLWYLRRGEGLALESVAELGSWPLYASLAQRCDDSLSEAARLARLFRTAARAVRKELRSLARWLSCDHASLSDLIACAGPDQRRMAITRFMAERLDSS